ncbi:MAG: GvpL/GvpF family gas vesicle protein [Actinomycetota bacterium]|nr:GvpL/GvpF family gas vesicle protein [Actinomycetota bacterium]
MRAGDESYGRLRAAIDELALTDAAELLAEARTEARRRVRSMLADALADSLLEHVGEQLHTPADAARTRSPQPTPADAARTRSPQPTPAPPTAPPAEPPALTRPGGAAGPDGTAGPAGELAWYVYGVVHAQDAKSLVRAPGVDPSFEVTTLAEGSLAAVSSRVALAEFNETRLREHLGDMSWVEAIARSHEEVLQAVRRQTTVIPMRMCTVYRGEDGVRGVLRREVRSLEEALAHLEGRTEWGVKAVLDTTRQPVMPTTRRTGTESMPATAHSKAATEPLGSASGKSAGSGTEYLERRLRERDREQLAAQAFENAHVEIHERLGAIAADGVVLPAQAPQASGRGGQMILNAAYLLDDHRNESFYEELENLSARFAPLGIELELTGPWPAYNFVPGAIGAAL